MTTTDEYGWEPDEVPPPEQPLPILMEPMLFTAEEAASLLRMDAGWLRRKAASRLVPCTVLGRTVRFSRANLEELITSCNQPTRLS